MTLVVVNQGEEAFLDLVLAVNYTLRLYTNDVTAGLTPSQIDALTQASFTEATFTGYSAAALTGGSWTTTQSDPSTGVYAQQTFTRSSTGTAQLVRGYYLVTTTGGLLRWFEQFPAPISVEINGDAIQVTPRITLDDSGGNEVQPGTITAYGANTAPTGWLLCDGTAVSRTTYAALFAVIGTSYGAGNGSTTFNVPDLRQRFPLGKAASGTGATLGGTGGAIDHTHGLDTSSSHAKVTVGAGSANNLWVQRKTVPSWNSTHEGDTANLGGATVANTSAAALGGTSDTANAPFQTVNYIVRT
mgnify:CR=1 FL=1